LEDYPETFNPGKFTLEILPWFMFYGEIGLHKYSMSSTDNGSNCKKKTRNKNTNKYSLRERSVHDYSTNVVLNIKSTATREVKRKRYQARYRREKNLKLMMEELRNSCVMDDEGPAQQCNVQREPSGDSKVQMPLKRRVGRPSKLIVVRK
jgi:hypothetical protein